MRLEHTIRKSMYNYPSLYTNRTGVIEHLFMAIGNGADWVDGQLVDWCERKNKRDPREAFRPYENFKAEIAYEKATGRWGTLTPFMIEHIRERVIDHNRQTKLIVENLNFLSKLHVPKHSYYPMSAEYSAVLNVPGDVRPDWLKGAIESAGLILRTDPDYVDPYKHKASYNIKLVNKILPRLHSLADEMNIDAQAIIDSIPPITEPPARLPLFGRARENKIRKLLGKRLVKDNDRERHIL